MTDLDRRYRRKLHDLLTLLDISKQLNTSHDPERVVGYLLLTIRGHLAVKTVAVYELREERLCFHAGRGFSRAARPEPVAAAGAFAQALFDHGAPLDVSEAAAREEWRDDVARFAPVQAQVFFPLETRDERLGVLTVGPKITHEPYSQEDIEYLAILANQVAAALANARYISRLVEAERTQKKAFEELTILNQAKSSFIGLASHELNTPISIIELSVFNLRASLGDKAAAEVEEMLETVAMATGRLKEIVSDLILLAKGESRMLEPAAAGVSIDDVLEAAQPVIDLYLRDRPDITYHRDRPAGLPRVRAEVKSLSRVLTSLVQNAIKFIPRRPGRVEVGFRHLPELGMVEGRVVDDGIGVESRYHERVFDRFFEISDIAHHRTSKTEFMGGGFGIGLSVCREIIRSLGGRIWLESEGPERGTAVRFLLPVAASAATAMPPADAKHPAHPRKGH
ncbi:MAG: GAF domain-containing sensor histidine kinase [Planctomycetes bacterium]|nr:GAF domain-containing sensor histidine kinase [Planctomycetota bacterium]